jgi:alanine racemase
VDSSPTRREAMIEERCGFDTRREEAMRNPQPSIKREALRPHAYLDADSLHANALAWRAHAGVPVRAVVKSDGYGWGARTVVRAVDDAVDGYYVNDWDEFEEVRELTARPIATLSAMSADQTHGLLDRGGIPTLSSLGGLDAADAWARSHGTRARVRIALRSAIGWAGLAPDDVPRFATALAQRELDVELSSHITDPSLQREQTEAFDAALAAFRAAGVGVVGNDLASTLPLAHADARANADVTQRSCVRVGVGLFGARFGSRCDVVCAIRVRAPVIDTFAARGQNVGYGTRLAPNDGYLTVVRCGYGNGFPRVRDAHLGILAVGMQFTTLHSRESFAAQTFDLIGRETDLDALAAAAEMPVQQLVAGLGLASIE